MLIIYIRKYKSEEEDKKEAKIKFCGEELDTANINILEKLDIVYCDLSNAKNETFPDKLFSFNNNLKIITLPKFLVSISQSCFGYCESLEEVRIDRCINLTTLERECFCFCTSLKHIRIPHSVAVIKKKAFYNCIALKSFTFCSSTLNIQNKNRLTELPDEIFRYCESLEKINIPDSVQMVGNYAFSKCYSLKEVEFGKELRSIGEYAFRFCTSLNSIKWSDSIKKISEGAFCYCDSLKRVSLPNSVRNIEKGAFYSCASLQIVDLPKYVETIGEFVFSECNNLVNFKFKKAPRSQEIMHYCLVKGVLYDRKRTELIRFPPNKKVNFYHLPSTVKTIKSFAFDNCSFIRKITQRDDKRVINSDGCVTVPYGLQYIRSDSFKKCINLKKIKLVNPSTYISDYCFFNCESLYFIEISTHSFKNTFKELPQYFYQNKMTVCIGENIIYYHNKCEIGFAVKGILNKRKMLYFDCTLLSAKEYKRQTEILEEFNKLKNPSYMMNHLFITFTCCF